MSFIFWSDVTFIYIMYYIIIYVICQIGNYLVDTYLSRDSMYVILYVLGIVFIINAAFLYINWARLIVLYPAIYYLLEKRVQLYKPDSLLGIKTYNHVPYDTGLRWYQPALPFYHPW